MSIRSFLNTIIFIIKFKLAIAHFQRLELVNSELRFLNSNDVIVERSNGTKVQIYVDDGREFQQILQLRARHLFPLGKGGIFWYLFHIKFLDSLLATARHYFLCQKLDG